MMTTTHHTAIATGAPATAATVNNPLGQLDAAIITVVAQSQAALDAALLAGAAVTAANGPASQGQKVVTVDSTTGFVAGCSVEYALVGGALEINVVDTVDSTTQLTFTTNIGTGGIANNAILAIVPAGMLSVTGSRVGATAQTQVFTYGITANEGGGDNDTRVEGNTDENLIFVDAGNDRVGIGTNAPATLFHVDGITTIGGSIISAGGNARGTAAVDLQTYRTADTQVASGEYSTIGGGGSNKASNEGATVSGGSVNVASGYGSTVSGGISNQASGYRSTVVGGSNNVASGTNSTAMGSLANASKLAQLAHGTTGFSSTPGQSQRSVYVLPCTTVDATPTVMYLDDVGEYLLTIDDDTVWNFRAEIVAMTADAAKYAAYTVTGLIKRANGTVAVAGVATTVVNESTAGWDATAEADDTNKALNITVTGEAGTTIRWVAAVYTTEVTFAS